MALFIKIFWKLLFKIQDFIGTAEHKFGISSDQYQTFRKTLNLLYGLGRAMQLRTDSANIS